MKLSKCHFFTKEIQYLGHILSTKGIKLLPSKTQAIQNMHLPKNGKTSTCIPWAGRILQEIHKELYKNCETFDNINSSTSKIQVGSNPSQCILNPEGISHPSTNLNLSESEETLHSLYRCIQWCMWSSTFPGTWWYGITYSLPLTHIYWHSIQMEYHRTRGIWSILCSHKVELVP